MNIHKSPISALTRAFSQHKKALMVISLLVLAVSLIAYCFWSKQAWEGYSHSTRQRSESARNAIDAALALPASNDEQRKLKYDTVVTASSDITKGEDSACNLNPLIQWQRSLGFLNLATIVNDCNTEKEKLGALNGDLKKVIAYIGDEQAVASLLENVKPKSSDLLVDSSWADQLKLWESFSATIGARKVSSEFTATKALVQERSSVVEAAWREVIAAHGAKDKSRYLKSQTALVSSYAALNTIPDMSNRYLLNLISSFRNLYGQAFK